MAKLLVFGNEKGGAGKSTLAMHVATALLQSDCNVGIIDLDLRQVSLKRFFENRAEFQARNSLSLPMAKVADLSVDASQPAELQEEALDATITSLGDVVDYIVIDCPGALTPLSAGAHIRADWLITPLNDSFIDFDLLAKVDPDTNKVIGPSIYSEMVWKARGQRQLKGGQPIDWIVARNRLPSQYMHNKRKIGEALQQLSARIGFRTIAGLSDRVVFKELFPKGLTITDPQEATQLASSMSNIAAKQELRDLMHELNLPDLKLGF